jgi:hypothetical protein
MTGQLQSGVNSVQLHPQPCGCNLRCRGRRAAAAAGEPRDRSFITNLSQRRAFVSEVHLSVDSNLLPSCSLACRTCTGPVLPGAH